jgi:uncharacterized protein (DUF427 family)
VNTQLDPHAEEREKWRAFPRERPINIETPGPGQESVWDYPRPPRLEPVPQRVRVEFAGIVLADSVGAWRVCETSSPPVYYIPRKDVQTQYLEPYQEPSFCEWKGVASYWTVRVEDRVAEKAAWSYETPDEGFESIRNHLAFYAGKMDACYVGEDLVTPQPGEYYGGWITPNVVGPFKGVPGSSRW